MQPDLSDAVTAAKLLLGWKLVHYSPQGITSGYIVETEAYDMSESASHSYGGLRARNAPMYKRAGTVYVYFIYGMHYCMNIVTGPTDHGQAVLIRALEPVEGIELMKQRRGVESLKNLTNGPAKLAQALGINKDQNAIHLDDGIISLEPGITPPKVIQTTRIGISKAVDHPWRFYVANNPYVSAR